MSSNLFTALFQLLLFLLMCGTLLCGQVCADESTSTTVPEKTVVLFQTEQNMGDVLKADGSGNEEKVKEIKLKNFYTPAFVSAGDVFVAMTGIYYTNTNQKNITVLTKYFDTNGKADLIDSVFKNPATEWKAQFAFYDECTGSDSCKGTSALKGLVAAAKDSNMYLLLVNASSNTDGALTLEFRLAEGTVNTSNNRKITWSIKGQLTSAGDNEFTDYLKKTKKLSNGALSGSAIVTEQKILFLLRVQTDGKQTFFAFINLDSAENAKNLQFLSSNEIAKKCFLYFVLWKNKIIVIPTHCEGEVSNKKVNEITDLTKPSDWTKTSEEFSHFVSFFHDKSDFITANIKNEVLLFTQKKKSKQPPTSDDKHDVYLWVTDGKHVYNAGKFLTDVNVTSINFLYTKEELLVLYQQWESREPKTIVLRQLKIQLDNIKTVIDAWKNTDGSVKTVCSGKILCDAKLSTDGLVGFLRTTMTKDADTIWKDEYYYVNATVTNGATKVTNGFTFSGTGVGAQWPVGKEQNDQAYNFTDPGFTLLATVEIGKNNNEKTFDNSLLGLILKDENNRRVGLLCSGGNWAVGDKTRILKRSGEKCEQEETYFVGIVLKKTEKLAIYVDGKKLNDLDNQELNIGLSQNIAHFYFGADTEGTGGTQKLAKTDVAITNVLLYNRPIDEDKIKNIKAQKREKPKPLPTPLNGTINTQEDGKSTSETDRTSGTSATPTATEKDGAEIKLCSFLKNDFTVFALLLLAWFTLLARYA